MDIIGSIDEIIMVENNIIISLEKLLSYKFKKEFRNIFDVNKNTVPLSKYLNYSDGYPFKPEMYNANGKYNIITIKNINNLNIDDHFENKISNIDKFSHDIIVNVGEILMSLTGNAGRIAINHLDNVLLNQRVAKIFGNIPNTNVFIYCLMKEKEMEKYIMSISSGTSQKNLSMIDLLKTKINFVPPEKIALFSKKNHHIFNKIILCKRKIYQMKQCKNTLLPLLLNEQVL